MHPLQIIAREDRKLDVRRRDALRSCAAPLAVEIRFRLRLPRRADREVILRRFLKRKQAHPPWGNVLVAASRAATSQARKEFSQRATPGFPLMPIVMRR
jgi:hypothetical protein